MPVVWGSPGREQKCQPSGNHGRLPQHLRRISSKSWCQRAQQFLANVYSSDTFFLGSIIFRFWATYKATCVGWCYSSWGMALKAHPDKPTGSKEAFQEIAAAYEILSDEVDGQVENQCLYQILECVNDLTNSQRFDPSSFSPRFFTVVYWCFTSNVALHESQYHPIAK